MMPIARFHAGFARSDEGVVFERKVAVDRERDLPNAMPLQGWNQSGGQCDRTLLATINPAFFSTNLPMLILPVVAQLTLPA